MCNSKENKTPDQLKVEMIQKIQEQGAIHQYLREVATPGIVRNIKSEDIDH